MTTLNTDSVRCSCARHNDGSVTTSLCPLHAKQDPCLTMATVTGRRRHGSVVRGVCSACGWSAKKAAHIDRSGAQS